MHAKASRITSRLCLGALVAVSLVAVALLVLAPWRMLPAEDAIILHSFSRNLATTGVISFYPGGPPAEGATDFLWMLILAAAEKLGLSAFVASQILSASSLVGIGFLVIRSARARPRWYLGLGAAALPAIFPQYIAALVGFSVLPFAFLILLTATCVLEERSGRASLAGLLLCLLRPDGVVFAIPLLGVQLYLAFRSGTLRHALRASVLFFVLPGVLYMAWRTWYFGEWLPLPFLVKSDVHRRFHWLVRGSVLEAKPYLLFALTCMIPAAAALRRNCRVALVALATLAIPAVFYVNQRLDQNVEGRFFYFLPIGTVFVVAALWRDLRRARWPIVAIACIAWAIFIPPSLRLWTQMRSTFGPVNRNVQSVSLEIHSIAPHGTVLVTEAGVIPFYTQWIAYDAWGLNTREFAHHQILADDVRRLHPDVIVVHQEARNEQLCHAKLGATGKLTQRAWSNMTDNVLTGVPSEYVGYVLPFDPPLQEEALSASFPTYECWFINPDAQFASAVEASLLHHGGRPL